MIKILGVLLIVFSIGCSNGPSELGRVMGCVLKGTACDDSRDSADLLLSSRLSQVEASRNSLISQVNMLEVLINHLQDEDVMFADLSEDLQDEIEDLEVEMAVLQGYDHIVSIVDPCGDHVTKVDEIFLRLSTGYLIASYSDNANGLNTRFARLTDGTYGTTDGTGCTFTVSGGGTIVSPSIEY